MVAVGKASAWKTASSCRWMCKSVTASYSASEIKLDGQEYLIMREDDVLGILAGATKLAKAS